MPLALVYNQLLLVSYVPLEWLAAHILPVHKKGINRDVANYRPMSFTYLASKVLEKVVVNRVLNDQSINSQHLAPCTTWFQQASFYLYQPVGKF